MKRRLFLLLLTLGCRPLIAAPPANDQFAAASVQTGAFWLTTGTLHGATSEPNEPILTYMPNGPTAWWRWTPASTGSVRLRTWGSERANLLAVYRGSSLDTLRLVGFASSFNGRANSADVSFSATAGETYHIQVLGADYSNPFYINSPVLPSRIQLSLEPYETGTFVPANDAFAAATPMPGNGPLLVCTTNATAETSEPLGIPGGRNTTVWVSWTAPSSGVWSLNSTETDFDHFVAVYQGSALGGLTRLGYSDGLSLDGPGVGGGIVIFRATAGITYRIQLMGNAIAGAEYGVCRLSLQPGVPPANDDFVNAATLTGSAPTAEGWGAYATRETGEPGVDSPEDGSLWWNWTAPLSGTLGVISYEGITDAFTGTSVNALTALPFDPHSGGRPTLGGVTYFYPITAGTLVRFRLKPGLGRGAFGLRILNTPANDDFANRATLTGATPAASPDLTGASNEVNEINTDGLGPPTVWYRWSAPSSGRFVYGPRNLGGPSQLYIYTGSTLSGLTRVGNFTDSGGNSVEGSMAAVAGTEYAIQVRPTQFPAGPAPFSIRPAAPPVNDHFANATVMTGSAWTATGSNLDATVEAGEFGPLQQGTSATSSVWWRWTAPASGLFRLSTAGSAIDTVLTVSTGASVSTLSQVAVDQSAAWLSTGAVIFSATSGTTYQLRVDGQTRSEGALKLTLQPAPAPPNDAFASRLVLSGVNTTATGNLQAATLEAGETNFSAPNGGHSVWYEWTAPASGAALFRVTADNFNPAFGLYTGSAVGSLAPAITGGSGLATTIPQTFLNSYPVSSGTSYKIRVDGAPALNGSFQLSVSMPAPPLNDAFASRIKMSGTVVRSVTNNEGATAQSGEPAHAGSAAAFSVWQEWTAPSSGTVTLDTSGNTGRPRLAIYTGTVLNALNPIASDTITGNETFASLTFTATQGVTYLIAADSTSGSRGTIPLNLVSAAAVPANDAFANATAILTDSAEALMEWRGASAEGVRPSNHVI